MCVTSGRAKKPYMLKQSETSHRGKMETPLMFENKITRYAIDSMAIIGAMLLAIPFALVISAPFLGGL
jgi:hypothetical protein